MGEQHPKEVHSDLKDVHEKKEPRRIVLPSDLETRPPSRHDRHPDPPGSRSDHVPHTIEQGGNPRLVKR